MPVSPLPNFSSLPVNALTRAFSHTTNSYKFYWFLSILNLLKGDSDRISLDELNKEMLEQVWYPLNVYKLSFGKQDGFKSIEKKISNEIAIDNSPSSKPLFHQLKRKDPQILSTLKLDITQLIKYVPTRFIRPFLSEYLEKGINDAQVDNRIAQVALSVFDTNPAKTPYKIEGNEIVLSLIWSKYFRQHRGILIDFTRFHLIQFLQKNNPNVIGIPDKIYKPVKRNLSIYTKTWQAFLLEHPQKCIYSNKILDNPFTLDHFIPWSYYTYDHAWNLAPTPQVINSSKSDKLPSLSLYLEPFLHLQYNFFRFINKTKAAEKVKDDYSILFQSSSKEIAQLSKSVFCEKIEKEILMMEQKASSLGFEANWILSR